MQVFNFLLFVLLSGCNSLELKEGAQGVLTVDKSLIQGCTFIDSKEYTYFSEIRFKNDAYDRGTNRVVVLESTPDFYYVQFYSCPLK